MIVGGMSLYYASNWWERAFATYMSSEVSPDGCFRIDAYQPFWVLPSIFRRVPHPDPSAHNNLLMGWEVPVFKRAYEIRTEGFLGETVVYDLASSYSMTFWSTAQEPGRRVVKVDGFPLFDSTRCADEATLAKLATALEQREEAIRLMLKKRKEDRGNDLREEE
jgi:hypothetical protein